MECPEVERHLLRQLSDDLSQTINRSMVVSVGQYHIQVDSATYRLLKIFVDLNGVDNALKGLEQPGWLRAIMMWFSSD